MDVVNDMGSPFIGKRGGEVGAGLPTMEAPAAGGQDSASPTNVQEAGVDEPDIVKASGTIVYAIAGDRLQALDAAPSTPRMLDSLKLPGYRHELLVRGTRALVISAGSSSVPRPMSEDVAAAAIAPPRRWLSAMTLTEVDLSDPSALAVVRTLDVEGDYVSARLTGAVARVVVSSSPRGLMVPDVASSTQWRKLRVSWRRSVRRTRTGSWLPGWC